MHCHMHPLLACLTALRSCTAFRLESVCDHACAALWLPGRLPVESARKLRWFDKEDLSALTKQHMREKHQLLDTITALKTVGT